MGTERYEQLLKERGYEITQRETFEPVRLEGLMTYPRTAIVAGRKQTGAATIEVQLQNVLGYRSRGLAGVARISGVAAAGDATMTPRGWWAVYKSLTSGPKIATVLLWFFLLAGVWVVMLPGILLVIAISRAARSAAGVKSFDALRAPSAGRFGIWGRDLEAARVALPTGRQEALIRAGWSGNAQVRDGAVTLDRFVGYGRYDLFLEVLDAAEAVAAAS